MEHDVNIVEEELNNLKKELRALKRDLSQRDRTISAMENNFNIKMNMFRALAAENEKHQRYLNHMMKSSADFLILLNNELNVAYCSDIFISKIGIGFFREIDGKDIFDVYARFAEEDLFRTLKESLLMAVTSNKTYRHDIYCDIQKKGDMRAYRITNTPMVNEETGESSGIIISWSDTTDIINAKNEAERASKSKSDFLATMSHEIRTPLNVIIGITQIQMQKDNLSDEYKGAMEKIFASGNSLLGIINDILDMSKIETGKLELTPVDYNLPNLINDAVQLNIVRLGEKPIEFKLDVDENLPLILCGDEIRLKQILNNLLSNAIKYTDKGFVKLSISFSKQNDEFLLMFTVQDTGQGIKEEDLKRLFSEYLRFNLMANRGKEGTGLGLKITKRLVEMMKGQITVESEYGIGSTFTVTVVQNTTGNEIIGAKTARQLNNFSYHNNKQVDETKIIREAMPYGSVLVVDDLESNLYVAKGLLEPYELNIDTSSSGFAVLDKIKSGKTYDIIFMDHMMPKMDGIETTQRIRELDYKGVIIALTANALVGNDEMFKENGFNGFISKPIDVQKLNTILIKYIRDKNKV